MFKNFIFLLGLFLLCLPNAFGQTEELLSEEERLLDSIYYQTDDELVDEIITYAKKFLGVPYVYGGSTPKGFDCSGYVRYVLGHFGIQMERTSAAMSEYGEDVPLSEVQPGDLLFFKGRSLKSSRVGHVSLVINVENDEITFIHSAGNKVKISTFNESNYYVPRFIKAKRIPLKYIPELEESSESETETAPISNGTE